MNALVQLALRILAAALPNTVKIKKGPKVDRVK